MANCVARKGNRHSPFAFTSERSAPFTTAGRRKMVARLGVAAKLGFKAHPHAPMQAVENGGSRSR